MVNKQTLEGHWNEIKGKLHSRWGQVSDDDLEQAHGNVEQLIGTIQRKTGTARSEVEQYLEELTSNGESVVKQTPEAARQYADAASEKIQQTAEQAAAAARQSYEEVQGVVRRRPGQSLAVCFGVGVAAGLLVGLVLRSR